MFEFYHKLLTLPSLVREILQKLDIVRFL